MIDLQPLFGPGGVLERAVAGYRHRPQQLEFAQAVLAAIQEKGVLIAEAGTGTGKTFGYLVPALLSGGSVIISTGTKTLQDQLFHRDLPRVRAALGIRSTRRCSRGARTTSACTTSRARRRRARSRRARRRAHPEDPQLRRAHDDGRQERVLRTCPRTRGAGRRRPRRARTASARRAGATSSASVMKARKRAAAADVIVVNHHLFFADVALRDEGAADLLPRRHGDLRRGAPPARPGAPLLRPGRVSTQLIELARDAALAAGAVRARGTAIGDAADAMEKAARDLRLALGNAAGRTALAAIRDRRAFDAALARSRRRSRASRSSCEARSAPRRSATATRARATTSRASPSGARPTRARGRRTPTASRRAPTSCAGSRRTAFGALHATPLDVGRIFHAQMRAASAPGSSPRRHSR
jgi:ATP-dependent DNA helicase DinG